MTYPHGGASQIWRNGVGGAHNPDKPEIRDWGTHVQTLITALEARDFTAPNPKAPVVVASVSNLALLGEQTIDGVATAGTRVLAKDQIDPAENGIYVTAAGAWTRADDFDADDDVDWATVFVSQGDSNSGTTWICGASGVTLGTTALPWIKVDDNGSVASDLVKFALKLDAVHNPVTNAVTHTVGMPGTLSGNTASLAGNHFVFDAPSGIAGTLTAFNLFTTGAGNVKIGTYARVGDTFTVKAQETHAVVTGYNQFTPSIEVEEGDYLGFVCDGAILGVISGSYAWSFFQGGAYSGQSFTDAGAGFNFKLMAYFEVTSNHESGPQMVRPATVPWEYGIIGNMGQSLAEGPTANLVTTTQEHDTMCLPRYGTNVGRRELSAATANFNGNVFNPNPVGKEVPVLGTAARLRAALAADNGVTAEAVKSTLVLSSGALGGTSITALNKGTAPYQHVMDDAAYLASRYGSVARYLACTWMQGESDLALSQTAYRDHLLQLATDNDTDLRAAMGQVSPVPTFTYQTCTRNARHIALAQFDAARQSPLIKVAFPMYMFTYIDYLHIDAASSRIAGGYFAEAIKAVQIDGNRAWAGLQIVAADLRGNDIILTYNRDGLTFDTTTIAAQTDFGFEVEDGGGTPIALSSVEVINGRQVRLTCASAPASGWTIKYGVDATGQGVFDGFSGNLRDNAGLTRAIDGWPLHAWALIQNWEL